MPFVTETHFLEFWTPQDGNWIPTGGEEVDLKIPQDDYDEDKETALYEAADKWCDEHGYTFCQFLDV